MLTRATKHLLRHEMGGVRGDRNVDIKVGLFSALYGLFSPGAYQCGTLALFETMNMITSSKHAHTLEYVK